MYGICARSSGAHSMPVTVRLVVGLRLRLDGLLDHLAAVVERLLEIGAGQTADLLVLERGRSFRVVLDPAQHHLPVLERQVLTIGLRVLLGGRAVVVGQRLLEGAILRLEWLAVGALAGVLRRVRAARVDDPAVAVLDVAERRPRILVVRIVELDRLEPDDLRDAREALVERLLGERVQGLGPGVG